MDAGGFITAEKFAAGSTFTNSVVDDIIVCTYNSNQHLHIGIPPGSTVNSAADFYKDSVVVWLPVTTMCNIGIGVAANSNYAINVNGSINLGSNGDILKNGVPLVTSNNSTPPQFDVTALFSQTLIATKDYQTEFQVTIPNANFSIEQEDVQLYRNGVKLAYISPGQRDYATDVTFCNDYAIYNFRVEGDGLEYGDVLDVVVVPNLNTNMFSQRIQFSSNQSIFKTQNLVTSNLTLLDKNIVLGRLGIGTSNLLYTANVAGAINANGYSRCNEVFSGDVNWTIDTGNIYNSNDFVGIGTSNPQQRLHVTGDFIQASRCNLSVGSSLNVDGTSNIITSHALNLVGDMRANGLALDQVTCLSDIRLSQSVPSTCNLAFVNSCNVTVFKGFYPNVARSNIEVIGARGSAFQIGSTEIAMVTPSNSFVIGTSNLSTFELDVRGTLTQSFYMNVLDLWTLYTQSVLFDPSHLPRLAPVDMSQWLLAYECVTPTRNNQGSIVYSRNNASMLSNVLFSRVGYYMHARVGGSNLPTWTFVTCDAFTSNIRDLRIPSANDPFINQRMIGGMNVYSSHPGVVAGQEGIGRLEIWNTDYGSSNTYGDGSSNVFDYDDTPSNVGMSNGYGSFQIHDIINQQTIMAWNNHKSGATSDIGFGTNSNNNVNFVGGGAPDWTGAANGAFDWCLKVMVGGLDIQTWLPSTVGRLMYWFDATEPTSVLLTSGKVSRWSDLSGNGWHALQANASFQPAYTRRDINNRPAINFQGVNGALLAASNVVTSSNITLAYVVRTTLKASSPQQFFSSQGAWGSGKIHENVGTNTRNISTIMDPMPAGIFVGTFTDNNPFLYISTYDGATKTCQVRVNGTTTARVTSFQSTIPSSGFSTGIELGGWSGDVTRTLNGSMGEFMMFDSMMSQEAIYKLEGYLAHKWWGVGGSNTLPTTHPFKTTSPFANIYRNLFLDTPTTNALLVQLDASQLASMSGMGEGSNITAWSNIAPFAPSNTNAVPYGAVPPRLVVEDRRSYVRIDRASSNYFQLPGGIPFTFRDGGNNPINGFTMHVVARFNSAPSQWERLVDFSTMVDASTNNRDAILMSRNALTYDMQMAIATGVPSWTALTTSINQYDNRFHVYSGTYRCASTKFDLYLDGMPLSLNGTTIYNGTPLSRTTITNYIGRSSVANEGYLNADIAEVLVFNDYQAPAEMLMWTEFLCNKWGIK
jgi:hypothetical protein